MKTILVLENNEQQRILYKQKLSNEGYNVITANDGKTAIKKVNDYWPDIVIMNVNISDVDIVDVIGNILIQHKNIPIILRTDNNFYGKSFHPWHANVITSRSSGFFELKEKIKTLLNKNEKYTCNFTIDEQLSGHEMTRLNRKRKAEKLCA